MGEIKDKAEELTEHVGDYLETFYKLTALNATGKATGIISAGITSIVVMLFIMFAMLFAFMGIGWWLGEQMNNMLAGFGIVSGFYIFLIIIILTFRKSFLFPLIRNILIRKMYE
ncbi:MAG: hypothetical protein DI538_15980 [Azospira oryzae]|jgi:hypothetical protein|nr:hypothetical protein [Cytophaga sp.]PZR34926.1 MAG: hypothetical protein DI538_15980 [Azospira oryzae]